MRLRNRPEHRLKILVTGAVGFIGKHVADALRLRDHEVFSATEETPPDQLRIWALEAEAVVHLAGSNRPVEESEFARVNRDLTAQLADWLGANPHHPTIILSSSTQAELDNPYGKSKLEAENVLACFAQTGKGSAVVFRLPNVFGKWARPNYNSVVATFCYNVANGIPCIVNDPHHEITFVYIDDVVEAFVAAAESALAPGTFERRSVATQYQCTIGNLLAEIESFRDMRTNLKLPDFADRFRVSLYATYLSYLQADNFAYSLDKKEDARGSLAEFVKSDHVGQLFLSRTHPGITRGNHYHHTKTEKFLVVEGEGLIRFRHIDSDQVHENRVRGADYRVVDIPPGYTHSIENVGPTELVTLFWASEKFDLDRMDTVFEAVIK